MWCGEYGLHGGLLGLGCRLFLPQLRPPPLFAGLFVILMGAKFFLHSAPLDQFLESPQCLADRFLVVNPHAQTHSSSSKGIESRLNRTNPARADAGPEKDGNSSS